jgi:hypothetical protein
MIGFRARSGAGQEETGEAGSPEPVRMGRLAHHARYPHRQPLAIARGLPNNRRRRPKLLNSQPRQGGYNNLGSVGLHGTALFSWWSEPDVQRPLCSASMLSLQSGDYPILGLSLHTRPRVTAEPSFRGFGTPGLAPTPHPGDRLGQARSRAIAGLDARFVKNCTLSRKLNEIRGFQIRSFSNGNACPRIFGLYRLSLTCSKTAPKGRVWTTAEPCFSAWPSAAWRGMNLQRLGDA